LTRVRHFGRLLLGGIWITTFACSVFRFEEPSLWSDSTGAGGEQSGAETSGPGAAGAAEARRVGSPCQSDDDCGASLVCFRGSKLAGKDFCAEACDPSVPLDSAAEVCSAMGAKLKRCAPDDQDDAAGCPDGWSCYRTSLFDNQGLCIQMPVCSTDDDCRKVNRLCASSLVLDLAAGREDLLKALLHLDHLNCMVAGCSKSECPENEGCLAEQYDVALADLCTPKCEATSCPPNFSCATATSGPAAPSQCLPGLPGSRCVGDACIAGDCEDTGAGFNICTTRCDSDADCALLETASDKFYCVELPGGRRCVTPRPFHGENCYKEQGETCPDPRATCVTLRLTGKEARRGECRIPCDANGGCEPRGGLPHTCLPDDRGCFPGEQGLPCQSQSNCLPGLECLDVPPVTELGAPEERICTRACGKDPADPHAECADAKGYCDGAICRLRHDDNQDCIIDEQCISGVCDPSVGRCDPTGMTPSRF